MRAKTSQKAAEFLQGSDHPLAHLFTKLNQLERYSERLTRYLPAEMKGFCKVANISGNRLILYAATGAIASQIRFQTTELLRQFKQDSLLRPIQEIHCKVYPATTIPRLTTRQSIKKVQLLSQESAAIVNTIADSIEDPTLREVMKRIASHQVDKLTLPPK